MTTVMTSVDKCYDTCSGHWKSRIMCERKEMVKKNETGKVNRDHLVKNSLPHRRDFGAEAHCLGTWHAQTPIFKKDHPSSYEAGFIERQNERLGS